MGMNPSDGIDKTLKRVGLVEKSGVLVLNQFRDASDLRSQHDLVTRHGFHKGNGNYFALAGHHDKVGMVIKARQIATRNVTNQMNARLKAQAGDLPSERAAFRTLA